MMIRKTKMTISANIEIDEKGHRSSHISLKHSSHQFAMVLKNSEIIKEEGCVI